jgi:farnesyl diphosphate synthase
MHASLPENDLTTHPSGLASSAPQGASGHPSSTPTLAEALRQDAAAIETMLESLLGVPHTAEQRLWEAMRYAVLNGGKRLRGFLVLRVANLFGAEPRAALRVAASVEMMHAYSLVHDDLPAMDDDDLRRGKPSCHRAFDEATAILAGDALQTLALEILADPQTSNDAQIRSELVLALARAAGPAGMVGGQMADMQGEGRRLDEAEVLHMQALKTGRLLQYSAEAGAILGEATRVQRDRIIAYGRDLGAAFQVADDLLDTLATTEQLGKSAGKDEAAGKSTLVALLGVDGATDRARALSHSAANQLDGFGAPAAVLRELAAYVVSRRN